MYLVGCLHSFYIGYTTNVQTRLNQHNSGLTQSTKSKIPWEMVYTEVFETLFAATRRERFLKNQRNKTFYKKLCSIENK